ncbi:unnamed protein product [Gongylonema pulchrum]|uniref:DNA replication factor Dna2 N-terminal domain-containing protein n=1 Tax=Gongylonema pulchrum TaxID=637853 RepID=A0A3P7NFI0_9BILA|nr:unnamed protein product [Gongylonema pulchrum]
MCSKASKITVCVISSSDIKGSNARVLDCVCEETGKPYCVRLEGLWSSTPVQIGSTLCLIGAKTLREKELLLNWENGVVILESNALVPCTIIAQGVYCRRKAVLSHYFKSGAVSNREMTVGSVVHELFQIAVTRSDFQATETGLIDLWRNELYPQYVEQLLALNLSAEEIEEDVRPYLGSIVRWISAYMPPPLGRHEQLQTGSTIKEVVDVEDSLWNSCYGFKAKIDCTLKVAAFYFFQAQFNTFSLLAYS